VSLKCHRGSTLGHCRRGQEYVVGESKLGRFRNGSVLCCRREEILFSGGKIEIF